MIAAGVLVWVPPCHRKKVMRENIDRVLTAERRHGRDQLGIALQDESNEEAADEEAVGRYGKKQTRRGGVDMEVTFDSALENLSQRLAEKGKSKEAKSVWEQYEKRRRCVFPLFLNLIRMYPAPN